MPDARVLPFRSRDSHEQLGLIALEHLRNDRLDHALRSLVQAWLDSSPDRAEASPLAMQMNALIPNGGNGPGAA